MTNEPPGATPDALTKARNEPEIVEVPARTVIAVDGQGAPSAPSFSRAIQALYTVGYTLRFARKDEGLNPFKVGPLVGEWRAEQPHPATTGVPAPEDWLWSLQIGVPDDMIRDEVERAIGAATSKPKSKLSGNAEAGRIELRTIGQARFARILHVGPYATEPESFEKIEAFLAERSLEREPWHVEVYLSDPGRTTPEKLKTSLLVRIV